MYSPNKPSFSTFLSGIIESVKNGPNKHLKGKTL